MFETQSSPLACLSVYLVGWIQNPKAAEFEQKLIELRDTSSRSYWGQVKCLCPTLGHSPVGARRSKSSPSLPKMKPKQLPWILLDIPCWSHSSPSGWPQETDYILVLLVQLGRHPYFFFSQAPGHTCHIHIYSCNYLFQVSEDSPLGSLYTRMKSIILKVQVRTTHTFQTQCTFTTVSPLKCRNVPSFLMIPRLFFMIHPHNAV